MSFPSFASGEVLTAADMNAVGMWKITTQTFSAQTQVDFTGVFTSSYTNYRIVFDEYSSTVSENQLFRFRDSGGVITTSNYFTNRIEQTGATISGIPFGPSSGLFPTYAIASGTAAANTAGYMDIFQPNVSGEYTRVNGMFTRTDSTTSLTSVMMTGFFNLTTVLTGFSLVRQSTATISGAVTVYGYKP
jgi:hypothetical protein